MNFCRVGFLLGGGGPSSLFSPLGGPITINPYNSPSLLSPLGALLSTPANFQPRKPSAPENLQVHARACTYVCSSISMRGGTRHSFPIRSDRCGALRRTDRSEPSCFLSALDKNLQIFKNLQQLINKRHPKITGNPAKCK